MPRQKQEQTERPKETTYVVLVVPDAGSSYLAVAGDTLANGPEQAVRRVAAESEGTFVAVPARNWTIVEQAAETPPPVISQKVSKWADAGEPPTHPPETQEISAADTQSLSGDGTPRENRTLVAAPHPADAIEEDGA